MLLQQFNAIIIKENKREKKRKKETKIVFESLI
jgi:hypothetical protein